MSSKYEDIIGLPHHVSLKRPRMSLHDRAAQFLPFAALTGYHEAVAETARMTDEKRELREDALALLDRRLKILSENLALRPEIAVTYFEPDLRKQGGAYALKTGVMKRIDGYARKLIFEDGTSVPMADVLELESELFSRAEGEQMPEPD